MLERLARYASIDDLWSVLGYALLIVVSRLQGQALELSSISALASGMLGMVWLLSPGIRERNAGRGPNARVVFWAGVAVVSIFVATT